MRLRAAAPIGFFCLQSYGVTFLAAGNFRHQPRVGFYLYTMSRCMFTILLGIVVAALALSEIYVSHMDPPLVQHDKPCRLPSSARFSNFGAKSKEFYFGDFGRQASQATYRVHVERIQTSQP